MSVLVHTYPTPCRITCPCKSFKLPALLHTPEKWPALFNIHVTDILAFRCQLSPDTWGEILSNKFTPSTAYALPDAFEMSA